MSELHYLVRPSTLKEKAPLMVMLHGYGSDENDLFSFASELPEELLIVSLRAPFRLQPFGYAWYAINFDNEQGKWSDDDQARKSRDLVTQFIDELQDKLNFDSSNVTLLGFSQGTILSYAIALTYPEKVKNVVALSGYINTRISEVKEPHSKYDHLDFYCSHGSVDQVIPVDWARQAPKLLNSLRIKNQYQEFPIGHGVSPQNFFEFKKWLSNKI